VVLSVVDKPGHPDLELTLSGITAPRLGRRGFGGSEATPDEPFAFASREYLRKKVIGKTVTYVINHSMTSKSGKPLNFGTITLQGATDPVHYSIVSEGWAVPKAPTGDRAPSKEQEKLNELHEQAKSNAVGAYAKDQTLAAGKIVSTYDFFALLQNVKGKPQQAIVDSVRDGCTLRLILLPSKHDVLLHVSGVQTPQFNIVNKSDGQNEVVPEPGARESKAYAENCLLHRDVTVTVEGQLDKRGTFYGTVVCNGINWGDELLRGGWAKYVEWNAPPKEQEKMKSLEKEAQTAKLRLWTNYNPATAAITAAPAAAAAPVAAGTAASAARGLAGKTPVVGAPLQEGQELNAKVRQVQSGGALIVVDIATGAQYTISLSSVNVPRAGVPNQDDEPWGHEAREALRSRLVGKKVKVSVDYIRVFKGDKPGAPARPPGDKPPPPKVFCTVIQDGKNAAVRLVEEGFATVVAHRSGERRSSHWEALAVAEENARKRGKGLHGRAEAPKHKYTVVTQAQKFMPFLSRGRFSAVVDWVVSATKMKLIVPAHSCIITFNIQGIQGPMREDKWGDFAMQFTRDKCLQRDVEVEVESFDKAQSFRGTLYLKKKNFGIQLLEQGLAACSSSVTRITNYGEYQEAEKSAKQKRRRMWENWDEEKEAERLRLQAAAAEAEEADAEANAAVSAEEKKRKDVIYIVVTEFVDASCFYAQIETDERGQLDDLMKRIAALNLSATPAPAGFSPAAGTSVLAQFTGDSAWYRARVDGAGKTAGTLKVAYVDYGNVEDLPVTSLRPLAPELATLPAQAHECYLAYVKSPPITSDAGQEAAQYLKELVWGKTIMANIEYRDGHKLYLSVGDPASHVHVNASLIRAGLAKVSVPRFARRGDSKLIAKLEEEQATAKRERLGVWSFGSQADLDEDEEEDDRRGGGGKPKPPAGAWGKGAPKPAAKPAK